MDARNTQSERLGESAFSQKKARQFSSFLRALKDAQEYAQDLNCSIWDFATRPADVGASNVHINDLRWMIRKGWIQHGGGSGIGRQSHPHARPDDSSIRPDSCFILGQNGIDALTHVLAGHEHVAADPPSGVPATVKPRWDAERHELTFVGQIVKQFRWPAANQETILMAFEEESWPSRIDDPLPQVSDVDPKRRLSDSIKCLNRNQRVDLVRFRGDGTGQGIFWDARGVR